MTKDHHPLEKVMKELDARLKAKPSRKKPDGTLTATIPQGKEEIPNHRRLRLRHPQRDGSGQDDGQDQAE